MNFEVFFYGREECERKKEKEKKRIDYDVGDFAKSKNTMFIFSLIPFFDTFGTHDLLYTKLTNTLGIPV